MQIYASAQLFKISQAAKFLGISIDTLRRWESKGKLVPIKTPGGTRFYSSDLLKEFNPSFKTRYFKIPKFFSTAFSLLITCFVVALAIYAVYMAIPPIDDSLSSTNIKPAVMIASIQNMDNQNLNQTASIIKADIDDLIDNTDDSFENLNTSLDKTWTVTSEDCIW